MQFFSEQTPMPVKYSLYFLGGVAALFFGGIVALVVLAKMLENKPEALSRTTGGTLLAFGLLIGFLVAAFVCLHTITLPDPTIVANTCTILIFNGFAAGGVASAVAAGYGYDRMVGAIEEPENAEARAALVPERNS